MLLIYSYKPVDNVLCVLHYDTNMNDVWLCDVIGHMTIQLGIDDFLYVLNRNQTRILLSF